LPTLMITGCGGSVGHDMIHYLSVMPGVGNLVGVDVNEEAGRGTVKEALLSANFLGLHPNISFRKINLFDADSTAEILREVKPDVICHTASLGSWWITRLLPSDMYKKISPLGPWLPNHLALTLQLMQAVKKAGIKTQVVNGCFPDVSNVALGKLGLAPICGGGNMDHGCNHIRYVISKEMKVPTSNVFVYGVGHHGAFYTAKMSEPFYVKIIVGGTDMTDKFSHDKLRQMLQAEGFLDRPQLKGPLIEQFKTAASFLRNTLDVYFNTNQIRMSVPGPNGLPGAYPCRLGGSGAEVVLPDELTLKDAIEINEKGARYDGIERVKDDGTVVFLDENVENMKTVLGYNCKELRVSELQERASELNRKLNECYDKFRSK